MLGLMAEPNLPAISIERVDADYFVRSQSAVRVNGESVTEKLLAERDGILAWAVAGCLAWQREGLKPPASVVSATEEYFEAEDALGQWIEERCLLAKTHREGVSELFADWREWAERAGEYVGSVKRFSELMAARKFEKCRLTGGARGITGIALRPKPYSHGYPYRDD